MKEIVALIVVVGFVFSIAVAKVWVAGSLITSTVKAASEKCGTTYVVEGFVRGDWFCPEKKA
jgi:hypothetical protein